MKNLNFGGRRARDSVRRVLSGGAVAAGVAGEGWGQGRRVMTYIVEVGTELCSETMLEKCTIG